LGNWGPSEVMWPCRELLEFFGSTIAAAVMRVLATQQQSAGVLLLVKRLLLCTTTYPIKPQLFPHVSVCIQAAARTFCVRLPLPTSQNWRS
jgi:hypothetical protein